jgi:uncharacterized protein YjbI with pentapeptide repeats
MDNYLDSELFTKIDFTKTKIKKGEYDNCTFTDCNFENIQVSNIQFVECAFVNCNFSNASVKDTAFKELQFLNCKMIVVKFNECNPFLLQLSFTGCALNFSSFYQLKIPNTIFKNCNLQEVDFTDSIAKSCVFEKCDLKQATFENTNLEKSDFRAAFNFNIIPGKNRIKGGKFNSDNVLRLLPEYRIIVA